MSEEAFLFLVLTGSRRIVFLSALFIVFDIFFLSAETNKKKITSKTFLVICQLHTNNNY